MQGGLKGKVDLEAQLQKDVEVYNKFVQEVQEAKERWQQMENERLMKYGAVQKLAEIVSSQKSEEAEN